MIVKNVAHPFFAVVLVCSLLNPLAWGHAAAKISIPENGTVLTEPPTELSMQFDSPAKLISLAISGSDGRVSKIDISNASAVDGRVSVKIEPLAPDSYQVSWRAMGIDGHITSGEFRFVLSAPDQ